ncbi:uncharacterized protein LOC115351627 [Aquila chrysaetos chrysaetos]|uniref:uncharacterized protein LOC115351627 n=1 Tax=Aquila chrysaetos chrysaetos TaxID=223781 RepID=UPI001176CEFB|nr:uncharacterized protein LOC115351627 [Aquila chrysaetos chrysaetos]
MGLGIREQRMRGGVCGGPLLLPGIGNAPGNQIATRPLRRGTCAVGRFTALLLLPGNQNAQAIRCTAAGEARMRSAPFTALDAVAWQPKRDTTSPKMRMGATTARRGVSATAHARRRALRRSCCCLATKTRYWRSGAAHARWRVSAALLLLPGNHDAVQLLGSRACAVAARFASALFRRLLTKVRYCSWEPRMRAGAPRQAVAAAALRPMFRTAARRLRVRGAAPVLHVPSDGNGNAAPAGGAAALVASSRGRRTAVQPELQQRRGAGEEQKEASELANSPGSTKNKSCGLVFVKD